MRGHVTDATAVTVSVNGTPVSVAQDGNWTTQVSLGDGATAIVVEARDEAGNVSTRSRTVIRDVTPPVLNIASPGDQTTVNEATLVVSGSTADEHVVTVEVNGQAVVVGTGGAFADTLTLVLGANSVTVVAFDAAGNRTTLVRTVTYEVSTGVTPLREVLGADPALVGPALSEMRTAPVSLSTAFLYTGPNAVQTGVASGAIDAVRAGVIRGRVLDRNGAPMAGVVVRVAGHPDYGQTQTRANGLFDMAGNGGDVVVRFEKAGFLPVQRHLALPWQEMRALDDVVLTPLADSATTIAFAAPIEVARGPVETDASGSRRATMMFAQGTQATIVRADGTIQPAPTLTVRATEFTVGERGPKAMPAPLPDGTEYTYAVELSADEALAQGATVRFNTPVSVYVDNFLRFPVGMKLPVGYYDAKAASWIPSPNGRVVKIVDVVAGSAVVDANGDGAGELPSTLDSLGISPAELQSLASLYGVGASLWRWQATHFTPFDMNPPGSRAAQSGGQQPTRAQRPVDDPCERSGNSFIACENQSVTEDIAIQGTPFRVVHTSMHASGAANAFSTLHVPITSDSVHPSIRRVDLEIQIAGRVFQQSFSPAAGQSAGFTWDGNDAYGRLLRGASAYVTRTYCVAAEYLNPSDFANGCASFTGGCETTGVDTRTPIILETTVEFAALTRQSPVPAALGGWSLDAHHFLDPASRTLVRGDGAMRTGSGAQATGFARVAGTGESGSSGDGGPALSATFTGIVHAVASPDGGIYVSDAELGTVRFITRSGTISTVAGTGTPGAGIPNAPALDVAMDQPTGLAVDRDGALFIADMLNHRVLKLRNDSLTLVAGGNGAGTSGDGGLAVDAQLEMPARLAIGDNGSLLILDLAANRVREVTADGRIRTRLGGGSDAGCEADGVAALAACPLGLVDLAIPPDGRVVVASATEVRVLTPEGLFVTPAISPRWRRRQPCRGRRGRPASRTRVRRNC